MRHRLEGDVGVGQLADELLPLVLHNMKKEELARDEERKKKDCSYCVTAAAGGM